jgi:hypothetical protein
MPSNAMAGQIIGEGVIATPVAEDGAVFFYDESLHFRVLGFDILLVDPIVSDEWIGHDDDLAFIRGISENLLVACHARIKDNFSRLFSQKPERPPFKYNPVL